MLLCYRGIPFIGKDEMSSSQRWADGCHAVGLYVRLSAIIATVGSNWWEATAILVVMIIPCVVLTFRVVGVDGSMPRYLVLLFWTYPWLRKQPLIALSCLIVLDVSMVEQATIDCTLVPDDGG